MKESRALCPAFSIVTTTWHLTLRGWGEIEMSFVANAMFEALRLADASESKVLDNV
ncbi:hypothetical protein [Brytella acorum]|uniref:hypothetical protein n=1 Tax=Brytella acorum TaxID=2959299 RepID=UPI0025AE8359|nr:hypothetical protein [Brytella acorum]MDF3625600.1 hypothetical protein [Brytella acorum]